MWWSWAIVGLSIVLSAVLAVLISRLRVARRRR
jgi:hypothetical protein